MRPYSGMGKWVLINDDDYNGNNNNNNFEASSHSFCLYEVCAIFIPKVQMKAFELK